MRNFLIAISITCSAGAANAADPVPCGDAEAVMRFIGMSVDGMQAFSRACSQNPASEQCMAFNVAINESPNRLQDGDSQKLGSYEKWLRRECPDISYFQD